MAESLKAKAKRYARGEFTNSELKGMLGAAVADQVIDVATFGALSRLKGKAFQKAVWPLVRGGGKVAARGAIGIGAAAARRTPAIGMALTGYEAYHRGREDAERGLPYTLQHLPAYPIMSPSLGEPFGEDVGTLDVLTPALKVRKKVSKYAKNVGKAMKAVKASTKGGPKGKLSSPKTTFKTVSKTVSKIMKGGARPRGGITGIISKAVKGVFQKPQRRKKTKKGRTLGQGRY